MISKFAGITCIGVLIAIFSVVNVNAQSIVGTVWLEQPKKDSIFEFKDKGIVVVYMDDGLGWVPSEEGSWTQSKDEITITYTSTYDIKIQAKITAGEMNGTHKIGPGQPGKWRATILPYGIPKD